MVSLFAVLAFSRGVGYAQSNYFPGSVSISAPATYCVGAIAAPITGTVTMSSCTGAFTAMPLNVYWYYNTVNSTSLSTATGPVATTIGFATTTSTGTSVTVPPYTPPTGTPGLYYYFCVVNYPASVCNIDPDSVVSNTNAIVVGAPVFTMASLTPNPICGSDSVYFNANAEGATTYQWFGPGTSGFATGAAPPPFSVNIADAGVYTVTATNSCGTSDTTLTLTINSPLISVTATAPSPATFCVTAGSLTLTGSVTGGSGVTYLWQGPNGFTSTLLNPTFTPTALNSGVYTLTATPGGCPAMSATTAWIQVDNPAVLSTVSISPDTVCSNHLVYLTTVELYGTQFLWTGPNGYTSTLETPPPFLTLTASAGVYTLSVSNSCNTIIGTTTALVVDTMPSLITGFDTNVCAEAGVIAQFFDTTVGGHWWSSDPTVAKVNTVGGVHGISSGTAIIYYETPNGCYDSVIVHVGRPPSPISGNESVCAGDSTQYTNSVPGGIWSSGNSNILVDPADGVVTGISSGAAEVIYTTPGCPAVTYNISVSPAPLSIVGNANICLGGTTTLTDNSGGGTWSVSSPSISPIESSTTTTAVIFGATIGADVVYYTVAGCHAWLNVTVTELPPITVNGPNRICKGECAALTVTSVPAGAYLWNPGNGISCTACDSVLACPRETQNYSVTVTNAAHCSVTVTHLLTVEPLPYIEYSPDPFYMCLGTPKQIQAFDTVTADGTDTYTWYPNVYINNTTISNPTFSDSIDLVYTVVATSQYGCKDSTRVPVSVLDPASVSIVPDTIICIGQSHHMIATCTDPRAVFNWYIFNGFGLTTASSLDNTTTPAVTATPDSSTVYACVIQENACFTNTLFSTVFVDPLPAVVIAQPNSIIAGSSTVLTAVITNKDTGLFYEWTPSETVTCPSCQSTSVTPDSNTEYHVCVTSNRGCVSCDSVKVSMFCDKAQIFVPNTFTPNGDGFNDRFIVSGEGLGLMTHFTVFNRWGEVVFDEAGVPANDPTYGWDGTYKGQVLEPDVFMWILEITCETQGTVFKLHGDISLVR